MANINRIDITTTTLYVFLSDNTFQPILLTQPTAAFLYGATPAQRANYELQNRDRQVSWPDLGETIYLDNQGKVQRYVPEPVVEMELVAELA